MQGAQGDPGACLLVPPLPHPANRAWAAAAGTEREGTEIPIIPNISSFSELLVKSFQQMAHRMFDASMPEHTFHQSLNDRETPPPPGWQAKQTEI
ncbi:hypothetical protein [Herbaspirillum sp.]|uniref:hypothetical protein n=1 Tax=Herbaspirillum sp. TaxID=1890675 RepID=UPI0031E1D77D